MIISARFNGPPGTGNGGYTAGMIAEYLLQQATTGNVQRSGSGIEVTLLRPPPLETPLDPRPSTVADLRIAHGEQVIAEASFADVGDDTVVAAVSYPDAVAVAQTYKGFIEHPFPTCFVCGPLRSPGDGLRLFPGTLDDGRTATAFLVPDDISARLVWAALDCPGGWSVPMDARPYVLGRIAARVDQLPEPGQRCVVMGQQVREQGRRAYVHSTMYGPDDTLLATARATWFAQKNE